MSYWTPGCEDVPQPPPLLDYDAIRAMIEAVIHPAVKAGVDINDSFYTERIRPLFNEANELFAFQVFLELTI